MLIISKFFTLVLLGMLDSDVQCKALESAKLARKWIGSKNIYLYFAIVSSICKLGKLQDLSCMLGNSISLFYKLLIMHYLIFYFSFFIPGRLG